MALANGKSVPTMPSAAMTAYKALLIRPTSSNPVLASDGHLSGPRGIRVRHYPEPVCGQDYYVGSGPASCSAEDPLTRIGPERCNLPYFQVNLSIDFRLLTHVRGGGWKEIFSSTANCQLSISVPRAQGRFVLAFKTIRLKQL